MRAILKLRSKSSVSPRGRPRSRTRGSLRGRPKVYPERSQRVFVAMSGGVDSSVAAALLKERGFDIVGVFMKNWSEVLPDGSCPWVKDEEDARRAASFLNIPFYVFNFEKQYRQKVVKYFIEEYRRGRTPNPDVVCNREIKFGLFLNRAKKLGADFIATGHYARIFSRSTKNSRKSKIQNPKSKNYVLAIARDLNKDQSYFLWQLNQEQLKYSLFPLGDYLKTEVRQMAKNFCLHNWDKKDSVGICFMGELDVFEFLKKKIRAKIGPIKTSEGKIIGEHHGLTFYTIGQRKNIGIGGIGPFYAAKKDFKNNALIVVNSNNDKLLFTKEFRVNAVNWLGNTAPLFPLKCMVKIRYRHLSVKARLEKIGQKIIVKLIKPQRAITPGQSAVFYQNEEMLGGGIIENMLD